MCSKCNSGGKAKKLCPLSFGLAVGVVSFFAVFSWALWAMYYGMPPMMIAMHIPTPTLSGGFVHALLALIKGFVFGFFVALFYDLFACCFACRKSDERGECCDPSIKK